MGMRWLFVPWLVIAALGVDARAEPSYSCYTIKTKLRPEPQVRCAVDCEAELKSEQELSSSIESISACTPATASVWCMYGVGNYEQCFADRNVCIGSSPSNTVAKASGKPMREDVCTEKGKVAPPPPAGTEQTSTYACYSQKGTFDNEPTIYCELECERQLERAKDGAPDSFKFTGCVPATGSVWCTTGFGPMMRGEQERCYADHDRCLQGNTKNIAARIEGRPIDTTVCVDKGPASQAATATAAASPPLDGGSVDGPEPERRYDRKPHHFMVYGGLLAAGEKPDNSTAVALGLEHRNVGSSSISYALGIDAVGHYDSGPRGFGGRVALRAGIGGRWSTGSAGLTAGFAYGGVERSAAEIPFELFLNGSVLGVGVLLRYEQVHRFVDNAPMSDARFMNASGFSAWVVAWGKALDPKLSIGFRVQSRDDTDAAFFNVAWGVAMP